MTDETYGYPGNAVKGAMLHIEYLAFKDLGNISNKVWGKVDSGVWDPLWDLIRLGITDHIIGQLRANNT